MNIYISTCIYSICTLVMSKKYIAHLFCRRATNKLVADTTNQIINKGKGAYKSVWVHSMDHSDTTKHEVGDVVVYVSGTPWEKKVDVANTAGWVHWSILRGYNKPTADWLVYLSMLSNKDLKDISDDDKMCGVIAQDLYSHYKYYANNLTRIPPLFFAHTDVIAGPSMHTLTRNFPLTHVVDGEK